MEDEEDDDSATVTDNDTGEDSGDEGLDGAWMMHDSSGSDSDPDADAAQLTGGASNKSRELYQMPTYQDPSVLRVVAATLDWYRPSDNLRRADVFSRKHKEQALIMQVKRLLMYCKKKALDMATNEYVPAVPAAGDGGWEAKRAIAKQGPSKLNEL